MPTKLSTIVAKIPSVPNTKNAKLLRDFYEYMKEAGASERHQGNELLVMIYFANHLGKDTELRHVRKSKQIISFLDTERKSKEQDQDGR